MRQQCILCVQRVSHLVQLLSPTDHVGNHDFSFSPGQVLVHSETFWLEFPSQVIGQAQKLSVANSEFAVWLFVNLLSGLYRVDVMSSNNNFPVFERVKTVDNGLKTVHVVFSGLIETLNNGAFDAFLFCDFGLLNNVGTSDKFGSKFDSLSFGDFHLILGSFNWPL